MKTKVISTSLVVSAVMVSIYMYSNQPTRTEVTGVQTPVESVLKMDLTAPQSINTSQKTTNRPTDDTQADYVPKTEYETNLYRSRIILAKALKSDLEQKTLDHLLSSKNQINAVVDILEAKDETQYETSNVIKRIDGVGFLESAIKWTENPNYDYVIHKIVSLVENYQPNTNLSLKHRRSIAGDRAELYKALVIHAPEKAKDLQQLRNLSSQTKAIMSFAHNFYFNNQ